MNGLNGIPYSADYINQFNSRLDPSTVHVRNTALERFFRRYLTQKLLSVYEFSLPEEWDKSFFEYCMFMLGYVAVLETDRYGVIFQNCTLYGRGIWYQPTHVIVTNPLLRSSMKPQIGVECELIKLMPDYGNAYDLVSFYASMMAVTAEAAGVNIFNSKLAYLLLADDRANAEGLKKMFDQVASGNPAAVINKSLFDDEGNPRIQMLNQNLKQTYIAGDLMADLHRWENLFNTEIGIPNANFEKSERLITDEVNANNVDTVSKAQLWLETMKEGMKKANEMFGLDLDVRLRFEDMYEQKEGGDPDAREQADL